MLFSSNTIILTTIQSTKHITKCWRFCFSEKAVLSITLTSDSGEVLGFGAFYDYPGSKVYDPKLWEHEMVPKYGLDGVTVSYEEVISL